MQRYLGLDRGAVGGRGVQFLGVNDGNGVVGTCTEEEADGGRGGGKGGATGGYAGVMIGDGDDGEGMDFDVLRGGGFYFHYYA